MPFIATHNGETVSPHEVDRGADLECVECKNSMHVVDSHTRNGTVVVRHFRHPSVGGGEGGGGGCGGESDLHKRVKGIALDHVNNRYDDIADHGIEEVIGNRTADAYVEFSSPKLPFGNGFAIEVQYRHKDKDIEAVERNYLQHGYSVLWIDAKDDYYPERNHWIDLPEPVTVWPNAVPQHPSINDLKYGDWLFNECDSREDVMNELNIDCPSPNVKVRLPAEHYAALAQSIYRNQPWERLFSGTEYEPAMADHTTPSPPKLQEKIPFLHWMLHDKKAWFEKTLRRAYQNGVNWRRYGTEAQRQEWTRTIHRIVDHNTANAYQPDTIAEHHIKVIASHAGLSGRESTTGLITAEENSLIKRTDGKYKSASKP